MTKPNKPKPAEKPAATQLLDINTQPGRSCAPRVADVRAANIINNRPYKGKDELVQKNIIPPAVYAGIKDKIIAKQRSTSREIRVPRRIIFGVVFERPARAMAFWRSASLCKDNPCFPSRWRD